MNSLQDILYFISKCDKINYKISHKLLICRKFYLNTFLCIIMRGIILCKKLNNSILKNGDDIHIT